MSHDDHDHGLKHLQTLIGELECMMLPEIALLRIAQGLGMAIRANHVRIYATLDSMGNAHTPADTDVLIAEYARDDHEPLHPNGSLGSSLTESPQSVVAVMYMGEAVGNMVFDVNDIALLTDAQPLLPALCHHASLALFALKYLNELRREREQLILAREEERRRLRRNLHDSVGPTLAALNLRSGAIRRLIQTQPEAAEVQMGELREQIRSVITDIRRVIYDLRPPALDELGLLSAIREQARQMSLDGLEIDVNAPDSLPPLSAAAEVNAYFIVCEALTNVLRHSQGLKCWVRIDVNEHNFVLEVCDNGIGLRSGHAIGVGLNSMRERATELGGQFELESAPARGVCVRASLPLRLALRKS